MTVCAPIEVETFKPGDKKKMLAYVEQWKAKGITRVAIHVWKDMADNEKEAVQFRANMMLEEAELLSSDIENAKITVDDYIREGKHEELHKAMEREGDYGLLIALGHEELAEQM